jgi:carboxylesterase
MVESSAWVNPHLEGEAFFWEGGPVGVLLMHGFTATTAEVRLLGRFLHEHGFTVAGPLLPGHGTTPQDCNRFQWKDWAAAAESAYRQLTSRCDNVFIGGESLGGLLALYLASGHPQAAGVLTYAPALKITNVLAPIVAPLLAPFIRYAPKSSPEPSISDDRWQGYPVNPSRAVIQLFRLQRVVRRRLPAIRQPILILQGRLDKTVHPGVPETIYRAVQSKVKEIHWLEQSHHCVIIDGEWEQAARLTLDFIGQVVGTTS